MTQKPLKMGKFKNSNNYRRITKSAKSICKFLHLYFKLFNNQHTTIPIVNLSVLHKKRVTISDYSCSSGNWTRTSDLRVMSPTATN